MTGPNPVDRGKPGSKIHVLSDAHTHQRLGRHRWKIERTIAWLFSDRRLKTRYERTPKNYAAFLTLAAALTCYKHPTN